MRSDACTLARSDVETVIGTVTSQQAQNTAVPDTTTAMNLTACVFTSNDGFLTFAVTRAPNRERSRRFCSSVSAAESSIAKTASIREAVTFACWPPGPEDRDARIST